MKNLYLHIGFHKTGTSALQEYLNENREELEEKGIFYPKSLNNKYPGNVDLSWALKKEPPKWSSITNSQEKEKIISYYLHQIKNTECNDIIISSEDFSLLDNEISSIEKIKTIFNNYNIKIIAYIREPKEFIFSLYAHAVREKVVTSSFEEYLLNKYNFRASDFALRLLPWQKVFGKEKLIIKKYNKNSFTNGNLIEDFFHAINLELSNINLKMKKSNIGVHPWLVNSYINVVKDSKLEKDSKREILNNLIELSKKLPKVEGAKYCLNDSFYQMLNKVYERMKNIMEKEYGIKL